MKWKRTVQDTGIGLLVTALLFLAAEVGLALLGLADPGAGVHLSRGFDAEAAYLVPDPEHEGGWRTQFSDDKWPEPRIPPKGARTRVVLFGGSKQPAQFRHALDAVVRRAARLARRAVVARGQLEVAHDLGLVAAQHVAGQREVEQRGRVVGAQRQRLAQERLRALEVDALGRVRGALVQALGLLESKPCTRWP